MRLTPFLPLPNGKQFSDAAQQESGSVVKSLFRSFCEPGPPATLHDRKLLLSAAALQFAIILLDAATLRAMLLGLGVSVPATVVFAGFVLASVVAVVIALNFGISRSFWTGFAWYAAATAAFLLAARRVPMRRTS